MGELGLADVADCASTPAAVSAVNKNRLHWPNRCGGERMKRWRVRRQRFCQWSNEGSVHRIMCMFLFARPVMQRAPLDPGEFRVIPTESRGTETIARFPE